MCFASQTLEDLFQLLTGSVCIVNISFAFVNINKMWLIFPSSPFSCDSGRFLLGWGDKFSIFLHTILFSTKPADPSTPPKYQIYWVTKNNKGGLWRFAETRLEITFLNLFLRALTTKFKGVAGNTGSDKSMLLKPKVKWFRCFLNSEF